MDTGFTEGRIGPNAVLQLLPVLRGRIGAAATGALLDDLGIVPPPDHGLMAEATAHRLHRAVRRLPEAAQILREAGERTADYILAHRIPRPAQLALRLMPRSLAARTLSGAIARHAWTFAGSGRFAVEGQDFVLTRNPLIRGEAGPAPLCHWHVAVFTRLFRMLVSGDACAVEIECAACGDPACRFRIVTGPADRSPW